MKTFKPLAVLILLLCVLAACDILAVEMRINVTPDGSGDLEWTIGSYLQRDADGNLIPNEDGCTVEDDDEFMLPGYTTRERTVGDQYWCSINAPLAGLDRLDAFLKAFGEEVIRVNCLGFDDDRFLFDVSLLQGMPADTDTSDLRGDEYFLWQLTVPGSIDLHNAHQKEGNTLTWTWPAAAPAGAGGLPVQVNMPPDGRCPFGGVLLFLTVEEDGTGSARLTVPEPPVTDPPAPLNVGALTAAGWSILGGSQSAQPQIQAWRQFSNEEELQQVILAVPGFAGGGSTLALQMLEDEVTGWREYKFSARIEMEQYGPYWSSVAPDRDPPRFRFDLSLPGVLESAPGQWTDSTRLAAEWEYDTGSTRLTLQATSSHAPESETPSAETIQRNLETLTGRFLTEIPPGQYTIDPSWLQGYLLARGAQPGHVNNLTNGKLFACGDYQTRVLQRLTEIRIHPDPAVRALLDGLDYGPIEAYRGGHQAVMIFPRGEDWRTAGTVLDPRPKQVPQVFTISDWQVQFRWGVGPGEGSGEYPHLSGNPSAYPRTLYPSERVHPQRIGVQSPVDVLITAGDGRRLGVLPDGSWVTEIEGADFYPPVEDATDRQWLFGLPAGEYAVQLTGVGSGDYHLLVGDADGNVVSYGAQPIHEGEQAHLAVAMDGDHQALATPADGTTGWVEPILASTENEARLGLGEFPVSAPDQPAGVTEVQRILYILVVVAGVALVGLLVGALAVSVLFLIVRWPRAG
jgi:hypothetical protein